MRRLADFFKLVQNENMKIYLRLRTWIMLGIIVLAPILVTVVYVLVDSADGTDGWEMMKLQSSILFSLITIFTVVVSAESVAGEFSAGTIKLLLIRPWSRATILLSKYVALLLFSLFFTAVCFLFTWGVNALILGAGSDGGAVIPPTSSLAGHSPWAYMSMYYLFNWLELVVTVTLSFMISSAFRSGGLSIGLSMFMLFAGSIVTQVLTAATHKPWIKYILFSNMGLTSYLDGGAPLPDFDMTLGFSLAILAGYFIVFNLISWSVFMKRDVAA